MSTPDRFSRYAAIRFGIALVVLVGAGLVTVLGGWTSTNTSRVLGTCAVALVAVSASTWWSQRSKVPDPRALYLQLSIDALLTSVLCAVTEGAHAQLVLLYFPSIAAGAFQLRQRGAMAAATLASIGWIAVVLTDNTLRSDAEGAVQLFTETAVRIFAFYLVAALTGQLAEAEERTSRALIAEQRSSEMLASEHEMVLDRVRAAVVTLDAESRIVTMNPAALRLLGDVAGEAIGFVLRGYGDGEHGMGGPNGGAWEEARGGGRRWLCCSDPLPAGGRVIVIEDVTELHRLREVAARDERLVGVGRLAASMAHEIRNPLASLTGSLQLIQEDRPERLVEIALEEARRLNRLVDDFLTISRDQRMTVVPSDVLAIARDVAAAFARDPRFSDTVNVVVRGESTIAAVAPDRLRQVLWNLVLNGAQVMPRGGEITVQVVAMPEYEQGPEGVEIVVRDQGPGIPEQDRVRIFDPFFTTRSGGSGLGLATVDQIIRAHGGRIVVQGVPEGGTAFVLWLPKEPHAE